MDAETVNKQVRQALVTRGMKGILSMTRANEIKNSILDDIRKKSSYKNHTILIELPPMHTVGGPMLCDAKNLKVTVKPRDTDVTKVK